MIQATNSFPIRVKSVGWVVLTFAAWESAAFLPTLDERCWLVCLFSDRLWEASSSVDEVGQSGARHRLGRIGSLGSVIGSDNLRGVLLKLTR